MDDEATTPINGWHAGLCDYAGHLGLTTRSYEVPIYRRLAEMLKAAGYEARTDVPYPYGSGQQCDLVVTLGGGGAAWIEVKQAWKEWFSNRTSSVRTSGFYRSYLLGAGGGGLPRSHSAAQDFEKLEQLRPPEADYAGVLLIGFDSPARPMDDEVGELTGNASLTSRGWRICGPEVWPDRNCAACRIVCLFWYRATGSQSEAAGPNARHSGVTEDAIQLPSATYTSPSLNRGKDIGTDVSSALSWAADHPTELRRKAADILRRFMIHEQKLKRAGGAWQWSWTWEQAVAEILGVAPSTPVVQLVAQEVRGREQPYAVERYDEAWRFDRLLDHFEDALAYHFPAS
jgi:hypothetical protein